MDAEKRSMGLSDYSGDMRKGGRGAMSYRPAVSKEAAPGESGSYYDKVMPHPYRTLSFLSVSYLDDILFFLALPSYILLWFYSLVCPISPCLPVPPPLHHHWIWSSIGLSLWQSFPLTNQDWCLGEEGPCSLYSPPTVYKPHSLFNHTIPFRQVR